MQTMTILEAVAKRITGLLQERNLTQYQVAKSAAIDESNLYNILKGRCKTITIDTLCLIADGFGMTIQEFLDHPLFERNNLDY